MIRGAESWFELVSLTGRAGFENRIVKMNLDCKVKRMKVNVAQRNVKAWSDMSDHEAGNQEGNDNRSRGIDWANDEQFMKGKIRELN